MPRQGSRAERWARCSIRPLVHFNARNAGQSPGGNSHPACGARDVARLGGDRRGRDRPPGRGDRGNCDVAELVELATAKAAEPLNASRSR
jgi:hypothetical protein